jgi:uncharacterized glyoxalase superfamily protein PhnB
VPDPADPFEALRLLDVPLAPRPAFAAALRRRLEAALRPPNQEENLMSSLTPYLAIAGAGEAIEWYRDVLGAIETTRYVGDDGRIGHAELSIGGNRLMLSDEYADIDVLGPTSRGGTTVTLYVEVADVDYTHARAVEAGATSLRPPADQGYGDRNATIRDPFGHRWMLAQPIDAARAAEATDDGAFGSFTVTGRRPVEPGYLVVHTADLDRARAFFGALFDWDVQPGAQEGGGHVANTRFPLGFGAPVADRATTLYFRVDDIESYATKVEELGGRVLARNDHPSGGNAECLDDQGYHFELWRPAPGY